MLIQFTVENFRSFKERAVLNLSPSSDSEHKSNIIKAGSEQALSTIAIYGANASGKSNLFRAMTAALILLRKSNTMQVTDKLDLIRPFAFDTETALKPSVFEFTFIADDEKKYVYGFSADETAVYEEYLYCYLTAKPSRIFERTKVDQYKFNREDSRVLDELKTRNAPNKLFLSTATSWNYPKTQAAFRWLAQQIDTFDDLGNVFPQVMEIYEKDQSPALREFTTSLLRQADINIDDYSVKVQSTPVQVVPLGIMPSSAGPSVVQKTCEIITGHTIIDQADVPQHYTLHLQDESLGTQQLFFFSPILKEAFEHGKTVVIDEIDRSLHPLIVQFLISKFLDPEINTGHAQLIFSTHDTTLLTLDVFRRDEIYFTEKDNKRGTSTLYSLDEFKVRKSENIRKGYMLGRYGAIPFLQTEVDLWP